jgi:serine/threonine-protein kinase
VSRLQSNLKKGKRIGGGFFGDAHLGTDDVHGEVAVKVMRQQVGETPAEWEIRKQGLLAEGQRLKQATHRNVVQVYQLLQSDDDDEILLVMEYCRQGSLQSAFDAGPMRLAAVRKVATEVCFGLQALHIRQMLHRDIKPGNILIDERGTAKLGDFGLVTDSLILGYGSQAGYSDHIAPEVWKGSGTSVRTDIWALGMTVYRLLHGKKWYERGPAPQTVVADGGFSRRLRWLPHIPQKWRRFVRKLLQDEPQQRYQNAGEVLAALAGLPTTPDFSCKVTDSKVKWKRRTGARRMVVSWKQHSPRLFDWKACSEPLASGRRRSLGGSTDRIGYRQSASELEEFFSTLS